MIHQEKNKNSFPIVDIGFNTEWEAKNWYSTVTSKAKYGLKDGRDTWNLGGIPEDAPALIAGRSMDEVLPLLQSRVEAEIKKPEIAELIRTAIEHARARWAQIDKEFFSILSEMLDIPMSRFEPRYQAYFTLSTRAPFGGNTFMFNKYLDFGDAAMHEIMHIELLKEYANYCKEKGLSDEKLQHLKEILTVLLNEDAKHLLKRPDPGYTKHTEIRKQVLEAYRAIGGKEGNFKQFLDGVIPLVKQII